MTPRLLLFRSLWTNGSHLEAALEDCRGGAFDGVEGPVPPDPFGRKEFAKRLSQSGAAFVAEIAVGGGYVPTERRPEAQLEDFRRKLEASLECSPLFVTALAGCDAWPAAQSVDFLGRALELARAAGAALGVETHRSRSTFSPWATRALLEQLPELRLTCDFSHWCCVCERLVLDEEPALLALCASRALHVHGRVGYDQGPQVPHPAAPEHRAALEAHERWWSAIWDAQEGRAFTTLTPEFGPDGYLQAQPFTGAPVADLDSINRWMAGRQRDRFNAREDRALGRSA